MAERRILLLITDLEIGGTPTVVRELAIRLKPFAHVEVACLKRWGPVADQLRAAGVTVTAFDASRPWHLKRTVGRLTELVREQRIDTVFSFLLHANYIAAHAAKSLPGVRFLQSIQTIQPQPKWHWWLQARIWRTAEKIVVPSNAIVDFAATRCAIPREKFVVIPNAIDPETFERTPVFTRDEIRIGYLGRLDENKRPAEAIDVLALLRDRARISLNFFGDGPARAELVSRAAAAGLADRVKFHGAVARPQEALSQMDILLLPSRIEGFGLVLIEAMAAGVPVVAFDAGGVRDVVRHDFNGLLAKDPAESSRQLADCVRWLIDDVALRRRLIENGLVTVCERFTWDVILPRYRELLRCSTAAKGPSP